MNKNEKNTEDLLKKIISMADKLKGKNGLKVLAKLKRLIREFKNNKN